MVGLLALQFNYVPDFFREVFPRLGVGISVLLVLLILVGLFISKEDQRYWYYGLGTIGFIIAIVVISKSFEQYGWFSSAGSGDYVGWIVGAVLLIGLIIAVANGSGAATTREIGKGDTYGPHRN